MEDEADAELYKALADPTRRLLLDELRERDDQSLFELCTRLAVRHHVTSSRQAVTQHLAVLEAAGLVRSRRSGRTRLHTLSTEPLRSITERWPLPTKEQPWLPYPPPGLP